MRQRRVAFVMPTACDEQHAIAPFAGIAAFANSSIRERYDAAQDKPVQRLFDGVDFAVRPGLRTVVLPFRGDGPMAFGGRMDDGFAVGKC